MNRGTLRAVKIATALLSLGLAAGCACGGKSRRGDLASAGGREDVVLMRMNQMQAEMDSRFALLEQRIDQRPSGYAIPSDPSGIYGGSVTYAPSSAPVYTSPAPTSQITYSSSVPTTSIPGAPVDAREEYYGDSSFYPTESYQSYRDTVLSTPSRPARASGGSAIRVSGVTARDVQRALKEAGYNPGAVDGKAGRQTQAAIREFQRTSGLKDDGIVGKNTWAALVAYLPAGASYGGGYSAPLK